ncbi:molybdopterin-guanine dinucleotide biosynthesis protein B [Psychromonas sp. psych-6C06]|nr:molybdopterin-guanine dinucleotide biosynthesis protein B [Psychromonas sp. psych-6C06]PKF61700.1 molybdopterin-guanine dinucleotide biosynthesis protein B [Psychromonas sp. psych-6C06]
MSSLNNFSVPLLGFAAYSGTGKTTLLTQLIPQLTALGLNIAVVKHSHHDIEIDKPGKDSYQLRKAGACQLLLAGTKRAILFNEYEKKEDKKLSEQLQLLDADCLDLVLVEGYRDEPFNKIELHRSSLNKAYLFENDTNIIALASDKKLQNCHVTQLDINNLSQLIQFILDYLQTQRSKLNR